MRSFPLVLSTFALTFGALAQAQDPTPTPEAAPAARHRYAYRYDDSDGPAIGINTGSSGSKRDTLGVLVTGVVPNGPADKSGIVEGDRIAAVNGTSLRVSPADAGEPEMSGVMTHRLVRELGKVKAGDEVTLTVIAGGSTKRLKVKTVARDELRGSRKRSSDRAAVGIGFGGGSKRDTLGLFVESVTPNGPADKAGIEEGNRIAAINGVDVRVPAPDAEDGMLVWAKQERFTRVLGALKAGDVVELKVYSNGSYKTVKVTTAKASVVFGEHGMMMRHFADGAMGMAEGWAMPPMPPMPPMAPMAPMPPMPPMAPMAPMAPMGPMDWKMDGLSDGQGDGVTCVTSGDSNVTCTASETVERAMRKASTALRSASFTFSRTPMAWGGEGDFSFPGLRLTSVTPELASYFGSGSENGLLVLEASSKWTPLKAGDVVLTHNGRAVVRDGNSYLSLNTDEDNTFVALRKGKKVTLTVKAQ